MARLLVVDDDPDLLILLSSHYARLGHAVDTALSCEDGLAAAGRRRPDLVFLDFCLPKMDGARFIELLRGDPLTAETPFIVITAASMPWVAARLPRDPRVRLIEKPFDFPRLDALLDELLAPARPRS